MPNLWMDVDVGLSEVPINIMPLVDNDDFITIETDVNYNAAGLILIWHFVTTAGAYSQTAVTPTDTLGNYDWVEQGNGLFTIEIPASGGASINNDTEGFGWFTGVATGILPWRGPVIGFRKAEINAIMASGDFTTTQKASINTEADTALSDIKLDHLIAVAESSDVVNSSIIAKMASKSATPAFSSYDNTTDSLEANKDNVDASETKIDTIDGIVDTILVDTNELQGLITSSKIAAQVKGIDADAITASALKTDAVNEITAAIWAKVVDGTITFATMSKILLAFTSGKVVITSNSFAFYDQSNVLLFTLPITTSGRIPVIA